MKARLKYASVILLILSVFVFGLAGGVMVDRLVVTASAAEPGAELLNTDLIVYAWQLIQNHYVDREALTSERLTYGAIAGMVDALGDTGHSTFLTPEMLKQHHNHNSGSFEGIGAQVEQRGDHIVIVAPMDDSPALRAGLKPGDIILKVDGEDLTGKSVEYAISKIVGPAGTTVVLTIMDGDTGEQRELTLTRALITVNKVTWAQVPGTTIGVVRVSGFSEKVGEELKRALREIQDAKLTGVVLDLRNNPGGLVDEAVTTTSQFLRDGNVLLQKDANGNTEEIRVEPGGVMPDLPTAVLINYGSASASEIVAGALQDAGRARLLGETTFGTGTVLNTFGLPDGSAILLATRQWLTPNGRVIWHKGIVPDEKVSLPTGVMPLLPAIIKTMNADAFRASRDTQLLRAVEWLSCPAGDCPNQVSRSPNQGLEGP